MQRNTGGLESNSNSFSKLPNSAIIVAQCKETKKAWDFVDNRLLPLLSYAYSLQVTKKEEAIYGIYSRICGWICTLATADEVRHFQAAAAAARAIFELYMDIMILEADSVPNSVDKFRLFPRVNRFRFAKNFYEFIKAHPELEKNEHAKIIELAVDKEKKEEVDGIRKKHWLNEKGKPRWPYHWTGMKADKRAEHCGLECEEFYHDLYGRLSWHIHAGASCYLGAKEKHLEASFIISHHRALQLFYKSTILCVRAFNIPSDVWDVKKVLEDLERTLGRELMNDPNVMAILEGE